MPSPSAKFKASLVATLALSLGGCASYLDAKAEVRDMGVREIAARQQLQTAQQRNQNLQDELSGLERDVDRNQRKLASLEASLDQVIKDLSAAQRSKKISEAEANKLRGELDRLNRERADLDFALSADKASGKTDNAARDRQIADLERRKAQLEQALGKMVQ